MRRDALFKKVRGLEPDLALDLCSHLVQRISKEKRTEFLENLKDMLAANEDEQGMSSLYSIIKRS